MIPPTEHEHWPRLSTSLPHERHPFICQSCGFKGEKVEKSAGFYAAEPAQLEPELTGLRRWREHDQQDKPQDIIVVLCKKCSELIIEPHERLYARLSMWEPAPGAMTVCVDCTFRQGLHCSHPDLKENGGEGLILKFPTPSRGFVDSGKGGYSGPAVFYAGRVSCGSKEEGATKTVAEPPYAGPAGKTDACRSCNAPIFWLKTAAGKTMPVNAESTWPGDLEYDSERHTSHFSTCPDAAKWSRKRKAKNP
jgi:hypothetical protein